MNKLIIRFYKISKKMKKKYNLECNYRYIYYDYKNKIITSAGIPNFCNPKEFINDSLKYNKHKFTRKNITVPLF